MESFGRRNKSGGERSFGGGSGGGRSFGGGSGGGGRSFGEGSRKPSVMHRAVCGQCGVSCEVPFRPTGERPVLCTDCFKRNGDDFPKKSRFDEPKRFGSDRSERSESPSFASKGPDQTQKQLNAINAKLDKILEMLGEIEEDEED